MDGTTNETGRGGSSPNLSKRSSKILVVRVQMLDDTITMFQIQVNEKKIKIKKSSRLSHPCRDHKRSTGKRKCRRRKLGGQRANIRTLGGGMY
jgi:hypothetical protein